MDWSFPSLSISLKASSLNILVTTSNIVNLLLSDFTNQYIKDVKQHSAVGLRLLVGGRHWDNLKKGAGLGWGPFKD